MKRSMIPLVLWGALSSAWSVLATPLDKGGEDPEWMEFAVLRDGQDVGTFGFKTISAVSGQVFTSSKLELKTRKGKLAIQTHVEMTPAGKLEKYRKWVGSEGAQPDVIAFWKGKKLRIVSKVPGSKFTSDLQPPDGFVVMDRLGFHTYARLGVLWKKSHIAALPCVLIHKGKVGNVTMRTAGAALLKNTRGEMIKAEGVKVQAPGFNFTMFLGEKPVFLGFQSRKMGLIRKGWNLVSIEQQPQGEPTPKGLIEVDSEDQPEESPKAAGGVTVKANAEAGKSDKTDAEKAAVGKPGKGETANTGTAGNRAGKGEPETGKAQPRKSTNDDDEAGICLPSKGDCDDEPADGKKKLPPLPD